MPAASRTTGLRRPREGSSPGYGGHWFSNRHREFRGGSKITEPARPGMRRSDFTKVHHGIAENPDETGQLHSGRQGLRAGMGPLCLAHSLLHTLHESHPTIRGCYRPSAAASQHRRRRRGRGIPDGREPNQHDLWHLQREEGRVAKSPRAQRRGLPGPLSATLPEKETAGGGHVDRDESLYGLPPRPGDYCHRVSRRAQKLDRGRGVRASQVRKKDEPQTHPDAQGRTMEGDCCQEFSAA
mmetsp:Transcript_93129/g.189736  ORF Transcript_93129/g.189736 Transcript_93129/m.189736 type:complete len:240 (-) Transcript_93129:193-912(-)